jgi:hypothetical protein
VVIIFMVVDLPEPFGPRYPVTSPGRTLNLTSSTTATFKLGKRLVACLAIHRSAEPGSLVVRTDFEQRAALLTADPETYTSR